MIALTAEQRLQANFVAYLQATLGDDVVVAAASDMEVARGEFWLDVSAEDDSQHLGGPNLQANVMFELSAHESVAGDRFNEFYKAMRDALIQDPQPNYDTLHAPQACLDAMNRVPGVADMRPCSDSHLWDLMTPSYSSGPAPGDDSGLIMQGVMIVAAVFASADWDGTAKYQGTRDRA